MLDVATRAALYHQSDAKLTLPAVGDWVLVAPGRSDGAQGRLWRVLQRRSVTVRQAAGKRVLPQAIAANIDKFRQQLSDDDINLIETLTGPYMDRYGYTRLSRGDASITPARIEMAGMHSAQGRERAWRDLEQDNFRDYVLRRCRADYLAQLHARLSQSGGAAGRGAIVTLDPLDPDAFVVDD